MNAPPTPPIKSTISAFCSYFSHRAGSLLAPFQRLLTGLLLWLGLGLGLVLGLGLGLMPPFANTAQAQSTASRPLDLTLPPPVQQSGSELPELGDVASSELPLNKEREIGRQIMQEIRRDPAYLDDPWVENYLQKLADRLVQSSSDPQYPLNLFVIKDNSINAFALPGGYIGIHTGLILHATSESELASVIAHEISHVTQRHIARQVYQNKKMTLPALLAMGLAMVAVASSNANVGGAALATTQAAFASAQLAYTRDFEREADRIGFRTLTNARFDPHGMPNFFARLQYESRFLENNATAYLRTHPLSGERLSDMQHRVQHLPYKQVADSADFHLIRARLRVLRSGGDAAIREFLTITQEKKFANANAAWAGLAMAYQQQRQWDKAWQALQQTQGQQPLIMSLRGDIAMQRGQREEGLTLYRRALQRFPHHTALSAAYAGSLLRHGEANTAYRFLRGDQSDYRADLTALRHWRLEAEAAARLGKRGAEHRALGEAFAREDLFNMAIEQMEMARKCKDLDFYELSAVDARLLELKKRAREKRAEEDD